MVRLPHLTPASICRSEEAHLRDERVLPASTQYRFPQTDQHSISLEALVAEQGTFKRNGSLYMSESPTPHTEPSSSSFEAIAARMEEHRRQRRLERRPANTLHVRPNLEYYKEQARQLHKSRRVANPSAELHSSQLEIARDLGLASWPKLAAAIDARNNTATELSTALARRNSEAVLRIAREHPDAILDAGCVATPDELGLLIEIVPVSRHDSKMRTALLDAVAEHHAPEGLEECVRLLTDWSDVDADYAEDVIHERLRRAEESPHGERSAELFQNTLGVLSWITDPPDTSEYMSEND